MYVPRTKGNNHTNHRHEKCRNPHLRHFLDVRLQSDLEKENDDTKLREEFKEGICFRGFECRESKECEIPQNHTNYELPENGRLPDLLDQTGEFGKQEQDGHPKEGGGIRVHYGASGLLACPCTLGPEDEK